MRRLAAATAVLLLPLAGCTADGADDAQAPDAQAGTTPAAQPAVDAETAALLAAYDLDGKAPADIVDHLDRLPLEERPADLTASVRPGELLLAADGTEVALDLPGDRFYLSVAPYVDTTHDCFHHSLTTCRGELGGEEVEVTVVDDATGEVLVEETATTYPNGFVGFWLPRDVAGTVTVTHDGRTGEAEFSTTEDAATCMTTLRLA